MKLRQLLVLSVSVATAACASTPARTSSPCALASGDSIYLDNGAVYRQCGVERRAEPIDRSFHPNFRSDELPPGGQACYSAVIQFVVDETGLPEGGTAKVLRTNNPGFGDAALEAVKHWRYKPAYLHGAPVRQIVEENVGMAIVATVVRAGEMPRPPDRVPRC